MNKRTLQEVWVIQFCSLPELIYVVIIKFHKISLKCYISDLNCIDLYIPLYVICIVHKVPVIHCDLQLRRIMFINKFVLNPTS